MIKVKEAQSSSRAPLQRHNSLEKLKGLLGSDDLTKLRELPGSQSQGGDMGEGRYSRHRELCKALGMGDSVA